MSGTNNPYVKYTSAFSLMLTVFNAPYIIGKWYRVYHYFSSYRRQREGNSNVLLLCVKYYIPERNSLHIYEGPSYETVYQTDY